MVIKIGKSEQKQITWVRRGKPQARVQLSFGCVVRPTGHMHCAKLSLSALLGVLGAALALGVVAGSLLFALLGVAPTTRLLWVRILAPRFAVLILDSIILPDKCPIYFDLERRSARASTLQPRTSLLVSSTFLRICPC